jgi:hypothetical protein
MDSKSYKFLINHYYSRHWKRKMYAVSILEETNPQAQDSDNLVYSVKSLLEKRDIRYKKDAKELLNNYRENIKNLVKK